MIINCSSQKGILYNECVSEIWFQHLFFALLKELTRYFQIFQLESLLLVLCNAYILAQSHNVMERNMFIVLLIY